jgi:hypothetical protein
LIILNRRTHPWDQDNKLEAIKNKVTGIAVEEDGELSRGLVDGRSIVWGDIAVITGLKGLEECRWW